MKQIYQIPRTGELVLDEVPVPQLPEGFLLIQVEASVVSAGTERMALEFAQKSIIEKARSRPDLVRQVIEKGKREGFLSTFQAAMGKLESPQLLGYSCAGTVLGVGIGVTGFSVGDKVACAGAGYANHAEVVAVPKNLVAHIPKYYGCKEVSMQSAAFATLGTIAMHGVRLTEATLGETVAVVGLGLIGLITIQILRSAGCMVLGFDPDASRCALARTLGCHAALDEELSFESAVQIWTQNRGADSVIIAAATESNSPIELAARIARSRAKIISVGAVGTTIPRKQYFEKELDFKVSRSYGPGRYDPKYEEKGHDYPLDYVRWTENRNMAAFLTLVAEEKVRLEPLITHRFQIDDALSAYNLVSGETKEPFLGIVIEYPGSIELSPKVLIVQETAPASGTIGLGLIGAGDFGARVLLPNLSLCPGLVFRGICTSRGVTSKYLGKKRGFAYCTSRPDDILEDDNIHAVVLATRHNLHAEQVLAALRAGKHVFCEKPLCLNGSELDNIIGQYQEAGAKTGKFPVLMVGFNRRFSPMAIRLREFFASVSEPLAVTMRINAGFIPKSSWVQDPEVGGGRIVGELCHFLDFSQYLTNSTISTIYANQIPDHGSYSQDNVSVNVQMANESVVNILYVANGAKSYSKERVEVFGGGRVGVLDDFRSLELIHGTRRKKSRSLLRQDKGHRGECEAFVRAIQQGGKAPISFDSIVATSRATFEIVRLLRASQARNRA
jgi:predicted dehydrogenase/threonine dehydrogenase-like Zn-dependent dehydrogenase